MYDESSLRSAIQRHCDELDRCNQRGDRMMSMLDLLDAGSLNLDLAAYLMAKVARGSSFMVGASPGGGGKTTVMCALLNLVPSDVELVAATSEAVRAAKAVRRNDAVPEAATQGAAQGADTPRRCYICHEIGSGPYFAYLWGRDLRDYCALTEHGHILATNLHADDLDEAREQVCGENGVPLPHFNAFDILVFLRVKGGAFNTRRTIDKVYVSDGNGPHTLVFDAASRLFNRDDVDEAWWIRCHLFLGSLLETSTRRIEEVRRHMIAILG